jgi:hypothetical protein
MSGGVHSPAVAGDGCPDQMTHGRSHILRRVTGDRWPKGPPSEAYYDATAVGPVAHPGEHPQRASVKSRSYAPCGEELRGPSVVVIAAARMSRRHRLGRRVAGGGPRDDFRGARRAPATTPRRWLAAIDRRRLPGARPRGGCPGVVGDQGAVFCQHREVPAGDGVTESVRIGRVDAPQTVAHVKSLRAEAATSATSPRKHPANNLRCGRRRRGQFQARRPMAICQVEHRSLAGSDRPTGPQCSCGGRSRSIERASGGRVLVEPRIGRASTVRPRGCESWGSLGTAVRPTHRHGGGFAPGHSRWFPQELAFQAEGRGFESRLPL